MEVLELKSCIVCSKPHPSFIKSELQAKLIMSSLLPGAAGSVAFNNQLCMYFISKKLLNFTDDECMQFIAHFQNNPTTGWCQVFCDKCGVYVGQALDLHKKMLMLAGKIDELAITLQSYMTGSNALSCFGEQPNSDVEDEDEEETGNEYSIGGSPDEPPECISLRGDDDDDDLESTVSNDYELDSTALLLERNRERMTSKDIGSPNDGSPPPALLQEEYPEVPAFTRNIPRGRRFRSMEDGDEQDGNTFSDDENSHRGSAALDKISQGPSSTATYSKDNMSLAAEDPEDVSPPVLDEYGDITPENIPGDVLEALFKMQFSDTSSDEFDQSDKEWTPHQNNTKRSPKKFRKTTPKKKGSSGGRSNVRKSERRVKPSLRVRNVVADIITQDSCGSPTRRSSTAGSSTTTATERKEGPMVYKPCACKRCPSRYRKRGELSTHLKVHQRSDEMNNEFDCKACGYPNESEKNLRRHTSRRHQNGVVELSRHKKIHSLRLGSNMFKCEVCEQTFENFVTVSRHRIREHGKQLKINTFNCMKCDNKYTSAKRLQSHIMKYHVPVSKLSCELCANEFLTLDELKIHLRSHESTDRSEICEYCGTYFLHLNSLRAHIRKFHSEGTAESVNSNNNEKVYKCKHCDFTSHLRLVITQHGKIHTEEYRFPCNTREKPFSPKLHQQIANGNRNGKNPAYCDWCKKNYVNHNYLKKHHVRCKMRPPTADREIPLTEKPKEKKKSSFVIVTASGGGITSRQEDDDAEGHTLTVL